MLQMMARENNESYRSNMVVLMESVRAAVQAYADGKISDKEWPAPDTKTNDSTIRNAPSFVKGASAPGPGAHTYSVKTLGAFLGLVKKSGDAVSRLQLALDCLELIETRYLKDSELRGKNMVEIERVVRDRQFQYERDKEQEKAEAVQAAQRKAEAEAQKQKAEAEKAQRVAGW